MGSGIHFRAFIVVLLFFSCKSEKHTDERQFYYYPDKNVYYDPVKKNFLYSLNGAKSWNKFTDSNMAEPAAIGEKVVVFSKNADVYKDNENHRKLYAGKLYNISSSDTNAVAVAPEAIERKLVAKKSSATAKKRAVGAKKTTSGKNNIGRFLNKIFGKHK